MKENLYCAALLLIVIPTAVFPQAFGWKAIRPAESTIVDVERIFGERPRDHYMRHEDENGVYFFSFSDGVCTTEWKKEWNAEIGGLPPLKEGTPLIDWNLPEWTVTKLAYSPNAWITTASLSINLAKLKKAGKSGDISTYIDEKEGIRYEVQYEYKGAGNRTRKVSMVTGIIFVPAASNSNLLCPSANTKKAS